jgi:hypothetical protein
MFSEFYSENHAFCEKWKNLVQPDSPPNDKTWPLRFACWITKATDTHSEYVILVAFPLQQWLRERASVLLYKHIVYLVFFNIYVTSSLG